MSSRKLRVESVDVQDNIDGKKSIVVITFSRKLTQLEVSGVKAVLDGEIK